MKTWNYPQTHPTTPGPWDSEPDKAQWIDTATGYDCLVVRNRMGAWCGYVGVPPAHPAHGTRYDSANELAPTADDGYRYFDVHGGLTFSAFCDERSDDDGPRICHVPEPGRPEQVWWLGFDCVHEGDLAPKYADEGLGIRASDVYRTLDYVRAECSKLAAQLAQVDTRLRSLAGGSVVAGNSELTGT